MPRGMGWVEPAFVTCDANIPSSLVALIVVLIAEPNIHNRCGWWVWCRQQSSDQGLANFSGKGPDRYFRLCQARGSKKMMQILT